MNNEYMITISWRYKATNWVNTQPLKMNENLQ